MKPLVTVITASTANPILKKCVESVENQTHPNIQHLIFADGPGRWSGVEKIAGIGVAYETKVKRYRRDIVQLPYSIGKDRWNGHRQYAAGTYIAEGEYIIFLDDDNYLEPTHIEDCLRVVESGKEWAYSLRKLVSPEGLSLGKDNCESLGKWPSVINPNDYFVDVNCYFLPRIMAVSLSPIWFRKFREPGQPEIDRVMCAMYRQHVPNFECTYKYTVNYTVGNTGLSVTPEFFVKGNEEMLRRYNGVLPWVK